MSPTFPHFVEPLSEGLFAIDTGFERPRFDAAYLLVSDGRAAFIDTGPNLALPRLLAALGAQGLAPEQVDYVIPTHVHLDHAGGAGALMRELPVARLVVHPRGARHLIDPSALYEGALAVYGQEEMDRSYGRLVPVPESRVTTTHDGMTLDLGSRRLRFADTAGHARHHHCIWDEASRGWFSGDTFGISYREFDSAQGPWALPTTTPVQFEPEALKRSMQRLLDERPQWMYLTHFGRVGDLERLAALQFGQIDAMVELGLRLREAGDRAQRLRDGLRELYVRQLREHGVTVDERVLEMLELDVRLNAQGLEVWLDKR